MIYGELDRQRIAAVLASTTKITEQVRRSIDDSYKAVAPILSSSRELAAVHDQIRESWSDVVAPLNQAMREALAPLNQAHQEAFEQLREAVARAQLAGLPPNLRPIEDEVDLMRVLDFVEETGIPLYLVPRASIARELIGAPDSAARSAVLDHRHEEIVADCQSVVDRCAGPATDPTRRFVNAGLAAIAAANYDAAQALLTNILDTLLQTSLDKSDRLMITSHKDGEGPNALDLELREAYVMLPVWRSYASYWASKGDPIPTGYSRHASTHGVSEVQYNRANAVHVLMIVTSYAGLLNGL